MTANTTLAAAFAATLLFALTGCTDAPVDEAVPAPDEPAAVVEDTPVAVPAPAPTAAAPEDPAPAAELEPTALDEALAKHISFEFQGAAANDVIGYIGQVSGINVVIDPKVAETLDEVPVTMKLNDVSTLNALKTMARIVGAKLEVQDELVMFVPQ